MKRALPGGWKRIPALLFSAVLATATVVRAADDDLPPDAPKLASIRSTHYHIYTDLNPAFAHELAHRLDIMYGEYEKALPEFKQPPGAKPLPAFLFAKQADYIRWTKVPNTAGVFVASNHPFLAGHLGFGRDDLRSTLQHEAFHQFAYFAISQDLPPWINEGLAQVFEEGVWTGKDFWLGQIPPSRVREIQSDIRDHRLTPFKKFTAMSQGEWFAAIGSKDDQAASNYNQAWAMAHFLMETGNAKYKKQLTTYLDDMHAGESAEAALKKAFPDLNAFQNDFARWVLNLRSTPGATMVERQRTLGTFLIGAHEEGVSFPDVNAFRNYCVSRGLQYVFTKGRFKWETSPTPIEYFEDAYGRVFSPGNLFFDRTSKGPIPDLVCHASSVDQFRTHFYKNPEGKLECEVLMQKPGDRAEEN